MEKVSLMSRVLLGPRGWPSDQDRHLGPEACQPGLSPRAGERSLPGAVRLSRASLSSGWARPRVGGRGCRVEQKTLHQTCMAAQSSFGGCCVCSPPAPHPTFVTVLWALNRGGGALLCCLSLRGLPFCAPKKNPSKARSPSC